MQPRIIRVRPLDQFKLELGFSDGTAGVVDLSRWIVGHSGVFGALNDAALGSSWAANGGRVETLQSAILW